MVWLEAALGRVHWPLLAPPGRRGAYPHTDGGVEVRRVFHQLRSHAIEPFNGLLKNIFEWGGQMPVKGFRRCQLLALGAVLLSQLVLLYIISSPPTRWGWHQSSSARYMIYDQVSTKPGAVPFNGFRSDIISYGGDGSEGAPMYTPLVLASISTKTNLTFLPR